MQFASIEARCRVTRLDQNLFLGVLSMCHSMRWLCTVVLRTVRHASQAPIFMLVMNIIA